MENQPEKPTALAASVSDLWRWSTTPPQSYLVYFICLVLVLGTSFYAGTLKPKRPAAMAPPSASLPRN